MTPCESVVKKIMGEPYAGNPQVRFEEEGGNPTFTLRSVPREQYEYSSYGITNILDQNGLVKTFDHDLNVNTPEVKKVKSDFSNPFGYHGMWRDEHTGLYHTHYRIYDPQHVRWLTPDPAGYRDGQNLYRFYAGPNGVDVLGLEDDYYDENDTEDDRILFGSEVAPNMNSHQANMINLRSKMGYEYNRSCWIKYYEDLVNVKPRIELDSKKPGQSDKASSQHYIYGSE